MLCIHSDKDLDFILKDTEYGIQRPEFLGKARGNSCGHALNRKGVCPVLNRKGCTTVITSTSPYYDVRARAPCVLVLHVSVSVFVHTYIAVSYTHLTLPTIYSV